MVGESGIKLWVKPESNFRGKFHGTVLMVHEPLAHGHLSRDSRTGRVRNQILGESGIKSRGNLESNDAELEGGGEPEGQGPGRDDS